MRQARSEIIFNVLKRQLHNASEAELLSLTEQLQSDRYHLGVPNCPPVVINASPAVSPGRTKDQDTPGREGERIMPTTLLFVDDNPALIETATQHIGEIRPEWRFLLATTCAEARKLYDQSFPDAAVLDVGLPDGNGLDLLSEFKRHSPRLPIIVISGDDLETLHQEVLHRGGYSLLSKPFSAPVLVHHIESAISASRDQSPAPGGPPPKTRGVWKNPCALALRPKAPKLADSDPNAVKINRWVLK